jgi:hypothetical protein
MTSAARINQSTSFFHSSKAFEKTSLIDISLLLECPCALSGVVNVFPARRRHTPCLLRWDWYDQIGSADGILEAGSDPSEGAAMKAAMPKQVASGVYQLGLGFVNVFYVEDDGGGLWLIDAGTEPGAERVGGGLRALGRTPRDLRGVVITHLHGDHVGGLAAVK